MTRAAAASEVRVRALRSFEDPELSPARWDGLVAEGTDVVFLTHAWQRLWWRTMGEQSLLIMLAEREGELVAVAPMYVAAGTLMLVGSGSADYLDFIGCLDEAVLASLLAGAREAIPDFSGIELYHLPADSATCALLPAVAERLDLELHTEPEVGAPFADLTDAGVLARLTSRRRLRKQQAVMRRAGPLEARIATVEETHELVEIFLGQHGTRWRAAGEESFERPGSRELVRAVADSGVREGWARLTVLEWRGAPAAIDLSLIRGTTMLSWLVSRDVSIQGHSPGRLLGAHVAEAAAEAGIRRLDFGLGEEEYKLRDASGVRRIANWFMYP